MFHPEILEFIKKEKQQQGFIFPFYDKYSIAEFVPTILDIFNVKSYRNSFPYRIYKELAKSCNKVLTFVIDGFGYNHFLKYFERLSFFNKLQEKGEIFPITSVFPSTTPAALTTLHTGLTPQEHGLPEWTVYFEEFDEIVIPVQFRRQRAEIEDLKSIGGKSDILFEGTTVYTQLQQQGIPTYYFIYEHYYPSSYSDMTTKGCTEVVTFSDGVDLMKKLRSKLEYTATAAYFFVYWSFIDSQEHNYGPESVEHTHALGEFSELVEKHFLQRLNPRLVKDVLFLLTADHGQAPIRGEDIIYLSKYAYLNSSYQYGKRKHAILPTGAPHDIFLFIYPSKLEETLNLLRRDLQGKAKILTISEAIQIGLFGLNQPSERFLKRAGNILILPYKDIHIWYEHFPPETFQQLGTHGGLSEEEMIVPLSVARLEHLL